MLLTLEQEAKRQRLPMPSPERLEKVGLWELRPLHGVKTKRKGSRASYISFQHHSSSFT